jgi:hypothetical protein
MHEITDFMKHFLAINFNSYVHNSKLLDLFTCQPPLTHFYHFSANFFINSEETLRYIMYKFPNIKSMTINTNCDAQLIEEMSSNFPKHLSVDLIVDFFNYMQSMDSFDFWLPFYVQLR